MSSQLKKFALLIALAATAMALSSCYPPNSGPPYGSYRHVPGPSSYGHYPSAYGGPGGYYRNDYYYDNRYRSDADRIKLTAGKQSGKPNRPEEYHSREWYEKRGYDLDRYKHEHEASGNVHAGDLYKSRSSSSRSSSSNNSRSSSRSSSGNSRSSSGNSHSSNTRGTSGNSKSSSNSSSGGRRRD